MASPNDDKLAKVAEIFDAFVNGPNIIAPNEALELVLELLKSHDEEKCMQAIKAISSDATYSYPFFCEGSRAIETKVYSGKVVPLPALKYLCWEMLKDGDSDSDEVAERALALAKAEQAFNTIAEEGSDRIDVKYFPKLCKNLIGYYFEDEHMRTLRKITEYLNVIPRPAFLGCWSDWYQKEVEVEKKFDLITKGSDHIATADLPKLLEEMKVNSYCDKESIEKISEEVKVITRQAVLEWYYWLLFEPLDD